MPNRHIFRNVGCIDGPDLQFRSGVDIVIEDGIITEVAVGAAHGDGEDASGLVAVPGLINAHTHLGDAALAGRGNGIDPDSLLWPPDGLRHQWMAEVGRAHVVAGMRDAAKSMLAAGTVAFADFREQGVDGVRQIREALDGLPLLSIVFGRFGTFPMHTDSALRANADGLTQAQLREIDAVLEIADGFSPLWANDTTDRGLAEISERVRAKSGRLATHAGETPQYRALSMLRAGSGDVERVTEYVKPDFIVHMTAATPAEFRILADNDIPVVMCPRTQAALGNGIPPMLMALDCGVTVVLGTDNAMVTSPDMLAEMTFYSRALRAENGSALRPTAVQMLATTTTAAARTLGISATHGHIDIGRPATFFFLDMSTPRLRHFVDPVVALVTAAESGDVVSTYIDGSLVHSLLRRGGELSQ
ncbi:MAG: amidohydrolase family protein [Nakamurella sp.]